MDIFLAFTRKVKVSCKNHTRKDIILQVNFVQVISKFLQDCFSWVILDIIQYILLLLLLLGTYFPMREGLFWEKESGLKSLLSIRS